MIWDYSCNSIGFIDMFGNMSDFLLSSSLSVHDSSLYICGSVIDNIHIADTTLTKTGNSLAFIVKYVDTSFMTPYIPRDTTHTDPIDTGDVHITLVDDGTALVAYPNPFRQRVTIRIENSDLKTVNGVATAILTDLSGRREQVPLTPTAHGQYTLDLTSRPQASYLLTLTSADGKTHTVRLLKQSDIFGQ